jgi:hypothetical protein
MGKVDFTIKGTRIPNVLGLSKFFVNEQRTYLTHSVSPFWDATASQNFISYGSQIFENEEFIIIDKSIRTSQFFYAIKKSVLDALVSNETHNTEIIGYKAPHDLFGGKIKAGTLYRKAPNNSDVYEAEVGHVFGWHLPKEIVETWNAIFKPQEEIITINDVKITIGKDLILVDGYELDIKQILLLIKPPIHALSGTKGNAVSTNQYKISLHEVTYKIGCTYFNLNDLIKVVEKFYQLNGK